MITNIQKYSSEKNLSRQDSLQVFMQVIALKNLQIDGVKLIGGTALVMGHNNPRFSEDIDLTGVKAPRDLEKNLTKAQKELSGLLSCDTKIVPPKKDKATWKLVCQLDKIFSAKLHVDSQGLPALTHHPIMVEFPGVSPFIYSSIELPEIMADKLVALAFRNNLSGRDIFDLWYHWLKNGDKNSADIISLLKKKLSLRKINKTSFNEKIKERLRNEMSERVIDEWNRYLPAGLKDERFYKQIFSSVRKATSEMTI